MRHFLIPALLAATVAVPAVAAPVHNFSQDGDSFEYTAARATDGSIVLNGHVRNTGDAFKLRVANRAVTGRIGRSDVSFSVSPKLMAQLQAEVPADQALAAN